MSSVHISLILQTKQVFKLDRACLRDLIMLKVSSAQPRGYSTARTSSSEDACGQLTEHLQHLNTIHVAPCGNEIHLSPSCRPVRRHG